MKVRIKDTIVETREIISIEEYSRPNFSNRACGFMVELHKKEPLLFEWTIAYETTHREIVERKRKCFNLMMDVIAEWEKDKVIYEPEPEIVIPTFTMYEN